MAKIIIIIRNVGPIKEADFELNKVNVFMGPQSSGKSTIAKIISYCTWVEKDVATSQSLKTYQDNKTHFRDHLVNFHKIKGYFNDDSYIFYKSDVVEIIWEYQLCEINWVDQYAYKRSKISYIPSERNMVILPDVKKVEFGNTNIRSFLFDWFDARKNYPKENKLSILDLKVDYYYSESSTNEEDHIKGIDDQREYDILLSNASSGLQSITPLIAMIDYLVNTFYTKESNVSYDQKTREDQTNLKLLQEIIFKPLFNINSDLNKDILIESQNKFVELVNSKNEKAIEYLGKWGKITNSLFKTSYTNFIIEELEQNLFPQTQRDLVYYLLDKITDAERDHNLTITTHSPYILYALNNCMLGGLVNSQVVGEIKTEFNDNKYLSQNSWIDPKLVSVWEIEDGKIRLIQDKDNIISENYFDKKMTDLTDEYYQILNYYQDEE